MSSLNLSHMHTTYLINSITLSPYPTPCPPLYLPPRHNLVLASTWWYSESLPNMSESVWRTKMLLCDTCNAGWHMDCLLPPLTTIPNGTLKCPLCTPRHLLPQTVTRHVRLPSPVLDFDSDYNKNKNKWLATTKPRFLTSNYHLKREKKVYLQTLPPEFRTHTHVHAYHVGSLFENQV